jgi:glycosyltransferase involved in cell wall biosynthesis
MKNGVSFIICTYNGKETIYNAVKSIFNQNSINQFEVIIVDNNSNSENQLFYQNLNKEFAFNLIEERKQGLIFARRKGVYAAKFDYIAFIDDDNYIIGNWTDTIIEIFSNHNDIGAIGSFNLPLVDNDVLLPDWFQKYQGAYAVGEQWHDEGYIDTNKRNFVWGAGMCSKKDYWISFFQKYKEDVNKLPGRTGNLLTSGDDGLFCKYLIENNKKLYYSKKLSLYHFIKKERLKEEYLLKLSYNLGKSNRYFDEDVSQWYLTKTYINFILKKLRFKKSLNDKVKINYLKGYIEA